MKLSLILLFKNCLLKLFLMLIVSIGAYAQQDFSGLFPNVAPIAPNASSLFKFNNYQVNLNSGVPDISIPIYSIKMGDITVPINLRYHASGIKVSESASWVGLGWALNTGGEITRQVRGGADENSNGYINNQIKDSADIDIKYLSADDLYYIASGASGDEDYQPDVFSYSFPGKSGKFFFDGTDNNAIRLMPYSPINITANSSVNMSFIIKDELGYSFEFGNTTRDRTNTSIGGIETQTTSAWKLERINNPNGTDFIEYDYDSSLFMIYQGTSDILTVEDEITRNSSPPYSYVEGTSQLSRHMGISVTEAKVNEIRFNGGKVVFELSPNNREDIETKSLNKILVYSLNAQGGYDKIKEIKFDYSYFIKETDGLTKRLRLDALRIKNIDSSDEEIYSFNYNSIMLPRKTSHSQDYWGYYNGKANTTLIPRQEIDYISVVNGGGGSNKMWIGSSVPDSRFPVESYAQAATLERITYPTKGYTEFEFESNRYLKNGSEVLAGGLRIKRIRSYKNSNDTSPLVKEYQYDESRPNFHLSDYLFNTNQTYIRFGFLSGGPFLAETKRVRHFAAVPSIDIVSSDGVIVSYPKVTEFQFDGSAPNGKTVYEFRDYGDIISNSQASSVLGRPVIISKFYNRGQLSNKTIFGYDPTTATYYKNKSSSYTYSAFSPAQYDKIGLVVSQNIVTEGSEPAYAEGDDDIRYSYSNYVMESADNYITSKTETIYEGINNPIITSTQYFYDNIKHQQVTRQKVTRNHSKDEVVQTLYAQDYSGGATFINVMKSNLWIGYPIERVKYEIDPSGQINIEEAILTRYYSEGNGLGEISEVFLLERDQKVPLTGFNFSNQASMGVVPGDGIFGAFNPSPLYKKRIGYDLYDEIGNILGYSITEGTPTVYLWGYQNRYLIAKIENATLSDVAQALELSSIQELKNVSEGDIGQVDGLRSSLENAMVTTFTYNPMIGIATIKNPKGVIKTYIYDPFNRLKEIRDLNNNLIEDYKYHYKNQP